MYGLRFEMKNPLLLPLSSLPKVGTVIAKSLAKLVGRDRVFDLLLHLPTKVEQIRFCPRLFDVESEELIIIKTKVESHLKPATTKQPYKVICYTPSGYLSLIFFRIFPSQIAKMPIGSEIAVMGRLQKISGENQIIHPSEILPADKISTLPQLDVIYPLSSGITQRFLIQKIKEVCEKISHNYTSREARSVDWSAEWSTEWPMEWINHHLMQKEGWSGIMESLRKIHNPKSESDFLPNNPYRKRLAYDELLAWQIAVLFTKSQSKREKKFVQISTNLAEEFFLSLPFQPTKSQIEANREITAEINSCKKMLRLLQGDVGSGKTIIAISACLNSISQQKQACVIAPTSILTKQHYSYFRKLLSGFDLNIEILTSSTSKSHRKKILTNLADGKINILIATHAALEDDIKFQHLGLVVIDEQHRFGVMQRLKMVEKGKEVDTLLMSATPIPRSLMMSLYGDMDISVLNEKPQNRQKITTLVMSAKKTGEIYDSMKRAVLRGEKIYWICPAIEETSEMEAIYLVSVKKKFTELAEIFGKEKVALLHGKMKDKEKDEVMQKFVDSDCDLRILVATTVIEVGIDVSDATIIIIENSENFGLAQLHQLRGRVGRSDKKSFCILLYGEKLGFNGRNRLNILRESDDGFFIAEEDLKMRGSGELLGTKQSGFPEFKIANLSYDTDLLSIANKNAKVILHQDEKLQSQQYQDLLRFFGYDECLKMMV